MPNKTQLAFVMLASVPAAAHAQQTPQTQETAHEVVVTATYVQRRPEDIAGSVTVITAEQIQQTLSDSLADVIRYEPGLGMDTSARGGDEGFSIRGIGGNRVLTVIDGVRSADLYAAGPSSYGKDSFEVDDLKAVEVIRGPASVLYGADALGGVVLLRTRDAADYLLPGQTFAASLRTSGSSANDQMKVGASFAAQYNNVGSVLQLTRREFAEQDIKGSGRLNPQDGNSNNMFWKTRWDTSVDHAFTLTLDLNDETVDTQLDNELGASVFSSLGQDTTRRRRISLSHEWLAQNHFADAVTTRLHAQYTDADQQTVQQRTSFAFVNPANPVSFRGTQATRFTSLEFNQDTFSGMVIARKDMMLADTDHNLVYGISHEQTDTERPRDRFDMQLDTGAISRAIPGYPMAPPELFPNKTFPDTETTRSGIFMQNEISLLNDALIVVPGVRYDRYRMTPKPDAMFGNAGDISDWGGYDVERFDESRISRNLGLIYQLNSELSLFAQYAEGFRPPNFDEANQAFVNLGHGYATVPNPELRAETSQGIEVGARGQISRTHLKNLRYSIAAFDNRYDDFIESAQVGTVNGIMLFQDSNIGKARIYGIEATADWQLTNTLSWRNAIAWARGRDEQNHSDLNSVDPVTLVSGLRYQAGPRWSVEGIATVVAAKTDVAADDQVTGDAYQVLDLVGHYDLTPRAHLRFGVFNLLDTHYARWSRIRGLNADDATSIANAQATGINARLALSINL